MEDVKVTELRDDNGKPLFKVETPKYKTPFVVKKSNDGYAFFVITSEAPQVSDRLNGKWKKASDALAYLLHFIKNAEASISVRRDMKYEKNHPKEA